MSQGALLTWLKIHGAGSAFLREMYEKAMWKAGSCNNPLIGFALWLTQTTFLWVLQKEPFCVELVPQKVQSEVYDAHILNTYQNIHYCKLHHMDSLPFDPLGLQLAEELTW